MIKCENCVNYFGDVCYVYGVPNDDAESCNDWIYAGDWE